MKKYKDMTQEEKIELVREIVRDVEILHASPEYIAECARIEKMCDVIKQIPMTTLEEIQAAKEASRPIPQSVEKILLFKFILYYEDKLKWIDDLK